MKELIIVGAGGFGREVKFIIDRINNVKPTYKILGFYDDDTTLPNMINGVPFLGNIDVLINSSQKYNVVLGIGVSAVKEKIVKRLEANSYLIFPNIIDPAAIIGTDNMFLGKGNVICAGVIITCDVKIQDFVTLNLSCTVGHDTLIKDFASFMPGVNISGEVIIEEGVYVGTGAKIINQLTVGTNTIVGAGAVVAKSLPANCTAVGIPAKPIKFHD